MMDLDQIIRQAQVNFGIDPRLIEASELDRAIARAVVEACEQIIREYLGADKPGTMQIILDRMEALKK